MVSKAAMIIKSKMEIEMRTLRQIVMTVAVIMVMIVAARKMMTQQ